MQNLHYKRDIEIIRIIGIIGIIFYHTACLFQATSTLLKTFSFIALRQWFWIDVFFVLAGYFFYKSFTEKYDNKFLPYIKNRLLRIIPAYYIFILFYLLVGLKIEQSAGNSFILPSSYYWIHFFTFTVNIPLAFGNWTGIALEGLFGLCILLQFTILFGVLFSRIKDTRRRVTLLLFFLSLSLLLRALPIFRNDLWKSYFFTLTRMDGILLGVLLYILQRNQTLGLFMKKYKVRLLVISFTFLIVGSFVTNFYSLHNSLIMQIGYPIILLFIVLFLNFILMNEKQKEIGFQANFVYGISLARLPLIYLVRSFVKSLDLGLISTNVIFILTSLFTCFVWGLIFDLAYRAISSKALLRRYADV